MNWSLIEEVGGTAIFEDEVDEVDDLLEPRKLKVT